MKNFFKILSKPLTLIFVALALSLYPQITSINITNYTVTTNKSSTLKVHYIDVGQGDAILLEQDSHFMLIDGGPNSCEANLKNYLKNAGVHTLDYVVGTHAHEDHIGGLDGIINSFNVKKVFFPSVTSSTRTFTNLVNAVKEKKLTFTKPEVGASFPLGNATCTILAPNSNRYSSGNNHSIVLRVTFGTNSFLFTGDAETLSENEILSKGLVVKSDVLKVGHHGSKTSTSVKFLNAVNPRFAVISCGVNNDYGHPNDTTIRKLNNKNIITYRTDKKGSVTATSNGYNLTFNATK